jgi:prophage tail gpP-like protein
VDNDEFIMMYNDRSILVRDVMAHFNMTEKRLQRTRRALKLEPRQRTKNVNRDEFTRLYNSGLPIVALADKFGISVNRCYQIIHELSLSRKRLWN